MSHQAIKWALYQAPMLLTPAGLPDVTARFVLVARAERADERGRNSYAGPADLTRATGYDERTVERADRRLEKAGLLVRAGFSHLGTVRWHLDMSQRRADGDPDLVDARVERRRKADAARQQRQRDRRRAGSVTDAESVTSGTQNPGHIEGDVSTSEGVTDAESVSHGFQMRDVTDAESKRHGRSAPQTTHYLNHPSMNHPGTAPGGTRPQTPRPPSPSAPATDERDPLSEPLTPAQDQQGESLPRTRADQTAPGHLAPVFDIRTGEAS
jgi:hypothetical protein